MVFGESSHMRVWQRLILMKYTKYDPIQCAVQAA